jgi:hypothetical protein
MLGRGVYIAFDAMVVSDAPFPTDAGGRWLLNSITNMSQRSPYGHINIFLHTEKIC